MMERDQFYNFMKYSVQDLLNERGVEGSVQIEEVMKNNDQVLTGLVIRGSGECISPCIYLNDMFERYQEGYPLNYMANEVADLMEEARNPEIDLSKLTDYENAKEYLAIRLVGIDENEQWLADKVWEPMGDFAKVCYLDFGEQNEGHMTAVVTMGNMALMGATKEQMLADAQKNLDNKNHVFMSLTAMMAEMMMGIQEMTPEDEVAPIYVLTNEERSQGAAMIARPDIMKGIGDKVGCDYYVLPSSTHEVLIVPVSAGMDVEMLSTMVREVNATEVSAQDKLSDKVQFYDREREQLRNALEPAEKEMEDAKAPKEKTQER